MGSLSIVLFMKFVLENKCGVIFHDWVTLPGSVIVSLHDIMSCVQGSGKAIASSSRKIVRTGTTIPQHRQSHEGRPNTIGLRQSHPRENMDPLECNLSVVQEFYPNWKPDAHSHFVTVRGMEISLTPSVINQVLGTTEAHFDILTGLNISPPYQQIRHTLCGLHFIEVTRDRVCLAYALMKDLSINVGAVLKSSMQKANVHREAVWDDVPTDEDKRRTMSDSEFDSDAEKGDILALEGTDDDADMDE
ncbi:hypothetical protein H5410_022228 [Solanum commersonii]|uniref:Putative plant transposon protein domain-containing protein n=1 Tax=Solanum commersonii TaxID=4109 RepID=A0A9J5ZDD2_SOLCO|nr:hypothetical protein H5410_022228 [Solanum commersonii]